MSVAKLDQAIKNHPFRPKGIKVGDQLYKSLFSLGIIKKTQIETMGITLNESMLDGEIWITVDESLPGNDFELPTSG